MKPRRSFPPSLRGKGARGAGLKPAVILFFTFSLFPTPSHADLSRCHNALQGEINRLANDIGKAIQSCASSIRRARTQGAHLSRAADQCERSLLKVFNAADVPGRSVLERFRANLERLHSRKCSDSDLLALGYFVPGINAPGARGPCAESGQACGRDSDCPGRRDSCAGAMDDVVRRSVAQADSIARRAQLRALPDLAELIDAVIHLQPGGAGELGTDDCSRAADAPSPTPNYRKRPNLCLLDPILPCAIRQCRLSLDSDITLAPLGVSVGLAGHPLPLELCMPTGPSGSADVLYFSAVSHTLAPPPFIPRDPPIIACVDVVAAQGWCDCTGQGGPFMPRQCIDHVIDDQGKDDCGLSTDLLRQENDCVCASVGGLPQTAPFPSCATPGCDVCVRQGSDAPCHPGTRNGPLHQEWTGGSSPGDCALRTTFRLSFLPPAFCRAANGDIRGVCAAAGPADPSCAALGGATCSDARGANGIACDADDETPWTLFPVRADLTTGTSVSRIADWVLSEGVCSSGGNLDCIEDRNCVPPAKCAGAIFGCGSGPGVDDCEITVGPGAGIPCSSLQGGLLGGWRLVGSVPRLDQPAGLRDGLLKVVLECQ